MKKLTITPEFGNLRLVIAMLGEENLNTSFDYSAQSDGDIILHYLDPQTQKTYQLTPGTIITKTKTNITIV
ncbi:MAG: hypothetical protein H6743_03925 [Rickettsiaceae bacterium]|nr:hypothetical protein [Rickettsiaceae bacterium]